MSQALQKEPGMGVARMWDEGANSRPCAKDRAMPAGNSRVQQGEGDAVQPVNAIRKGNTEFSNHQ
jgi:hypothetical protein